MGKRLFSLVTDPYLADHQLDGTPFVPFVVLAESLLELATDAATPSAEGGLADLRLEAPLMLRKGREREVEFVRTPTRLEVRDGTGRPLCTATTATGRHPSATTPPQVTTPPSLAWSRRNLYPAVLPHGPTFQADLQILCFSPDEAVFGWTGIDLLPTALARFGPDRSAACVLGDLALQAAGLALLGRRRGYTLPWGAAGYERPVPLFDAVPTDMTSAGLPHGRHGGGRETPVSPPAQGPTGAMPDGSAEDARGGHPPSWRPRPTSDIVSVGPSGRQEWRGERPGSGLAGGALPAGLEGVSPSGMPGTGSGGTPTRVAAGFPPLLGDRRACFGEKDRVAPAAGVSDITCRVTTAADGKLDVRTFTADGRELVCWGGLDLRPVGIPISGVAQELIEALAALLEVVA